MGLSMKVLASSNGLEYGPKFFGGFHISAAAARPTGRSWFLWLKGRNAMPAICHPIENGRCVRAALDLIVSRNAGSIKRRPVGDELYRLALAAISFTPIFHCFGYGEESSPWTNPAVIANIEITGSSDHNDR